MSVDAHGNRESISVASGETLLRRFNPLDCAHVALDQGDASIRLKSGAISLTRDADGCSVYRSAVLSLYDIPESAVINPPNYTGLARLNCGEVRALDDVDVESDPWPNGRTADANPADVGHALIVCSASNNQKRRRSTALAALAGRVEVPDRPATLAVIRQCNS